MTRQAALLSQAHAWLVSRAAKRAPIPSCIPSPKQAKIAQSFLPVSFYRALLLSGQRPFAISCFRCRVESYRDISARGSENLPCQTMAARESQSAGGIAVIGSVIVSSGKPAQRILQTRGSPDSFLVSPSLLQTDPFSFFVSSVMRPAKPEPLSD